MSDSPDELSGAPQTNGARRGDAGPTTESDSEPFGASFGVDSGATAGEDETIVEGGDAAALRDQLQRLAAEFDNYRKRESRDRAESWRRAKADLVEKLLEAIDDLSRVAHPEAGSAAVAPLLSGVELVERKLLQALQREGLQRIEAEGAPFDPALHEAILTQPTDSPELDGRVAHVALPGYRFGDRLLRPAKVVVWKLR